MTPDDMTLNQSAIDALMAGAGASEPTPPTPAPVPAAPAVSALATSELASLWERVQKLEAQVQERGSGSSPNSATVQALSAQVQSLAEQMSLLAQRLPGTLGYGVRDTFVCRDCNEKGLVAAVCVCTVCGKETMLGWWPQG